MLAQRPVGDALQQHGCAAGERHGHDQEQEQEPDKRHPADGAGHPEHHQAPSVANVPIMKISECAKLIRRSTPYTIV